MFPLPPNQPYPWLVAWREPAGKRWWDSGRWRVRHERVIANSRDEAVRQTSAGKHMFLFALSWPQLDQALAGLVPEKPQSDSMAQGMMLGWLPMVAPEFVVVSSVGGATHAHPIRAANSQSALTTWLQTNYKGRPIGCGLRRDWLLAAQWLQGSIMDVPAPLWAGPDHALPA